MDEHIEVIRVAVAEGATAEQKAHGQQACRAILAALGAEPGKPIAMPGAPTPHPLARIDPGQALDLIIAKLSAMVPAEGADKDKATAPRAIAPPVPRGMRIAFVTPPPIRQRPAVRRRKP